ncbi:MAG: HD domain-containing protein [Treponema sp.]|jgi:poly(A) polymerase|nr:HD domain-containing protein [Treponema sp.]
MPIDTIISDAGFSVYLHGFSAIDSYLGRNSAAVVYASCRAELADLARLFENLRYPGVEFTDAAVDAAGGKTWYFQCGDSQDTDRRPGRRGTFNFLEFYQDCKTRRFYDPNGIYPYLRYLRDGVKYSPSLQGADGASVSDAAQWIGTINANASPYRVLLDGAIMLARYFPQTGVKEINMIAHRFKGMDISPPCMEEQRLLLTELLNAANPAPGFELLKRCGFIASCWPELAALDDVDHSKEYHPEGNVWKHTMEALRYRKPRSGGSGFDQLLSLGLLLHDVGKPLSYSAGRRRFDGHAELGSRICRRLLERLGFNAQLVRDVCYLVRNHMLPAALPRLPLIRTGEIMVSPLFPLLMELYRCDESSSFKGLDGYYQSSAAYRSFLKHSRNPYRSADGKVLLGQK